MLLDLAPGNRVRGGLRDIRLERRSACRMAACDEVVAIARPSEPPCPVSALIVVRGGSLRESSSSRRRQMHLRYRGFSAPNAGTQRRALGRRTLASVAWRLGDERPMPRWPGLHCRRGDHLATTTRSDRRRRRARCALREGRSRLTGPGLRAALAGSGRSGLGARGSVRQGAGSPWHQCPATGERGRLGIASEVTRLVASVDRIGGCR